MSYLLDALNKSKGDNPNAHPSDKHNTGEHNNSNNAAPVPQPMMYPSYAPAPQTNIYKWLSIVLALVLTLIIGIVLGNKYAILGVPSSQLAPTQTTEQQTATATQPPQAALPTIAQQTQAKPKQAKPEQDKPQPTNPDQAKPDALTQTKQPATGEQLQDTQQAQQNSGSQSNGSQNNSSQQKPQVVGYQPETVTTDGKLKDQGIEDISNDLLSKFNQAIKETEGTEDNYQQNTHDLQSSLQADQEIDGYLTRVPHVSELKPAQQMKVPALVYETHLYSSDRFQRWVKINGRTMQETQWISEDIQIFEIQKQFLILEMGHIRFSVAALTDWPGYGK